LNTDIRILPITARIGAEIDGVDLARPLSDRTVVQIRQALLAWKVLFFRGQSLGHREHVAFASRFGPLTYAQPYEASPDPLFPQVLTVRWHRAAGFDPLRQYSAVHLWHTDLTPAVNPPAAAILRAETVPAAGGDTHWNNLAAAYQALSPPLRSLVDGLRAEHRFNARGLTRNVQNAYFQRMAAGPLVSIHPAVRVHPETGERILFVNPAFTSHLIGVSARESDRLLELLFEHMQNPAWCVRFRWNRGDVAFWDNRATAHLAPLDLDGADIERVLYRTTIVGDLPVGVDGLTSQALEGEPFGSEPPEALRQFLVARPPEEGIRGR